MGNFTIGVTEKAIDASQFDSSSNFTATVVAGALNLVAEAVIDHLNQGLTLEDIIHDAVGHILDVL